LAEQQKTVLLIEDDHDISLLYSEVLRDAGYKVLEAGDGNFGLKRALEDDWDILLLDIMLPGKDGVQILKELKGVEKIKNKPVILLTNLGSGNIITECFKLGASGYLIKSEITPDKIVAEVTAFLS